MEFRPNLSQKDAELILDALRLYGGVYANENGARALVLWERLNLAFARSLEKRKRNLEIMDAAITRTKGLGK